MKQNRRITDKPRTDRPFSNLRPVAVPHALAARARARVALAQRRDRVWDTAFWGIGLTVSVVGLAVAGTYAHEALSTSGFYAFLSLAFDGGVSLPYLRELLLALVESLPVASIALATAFAFSSLVGASRIVSRAYRASLIS